jgi:hypothetical protein
MHLFSGIFPQVIIWHDLAVREVEEHGKGGYLVSAGLFWVVSENATVEVRKNASPEC